MGLLSDLDDFWPEYLRDHAHPGNRRLHRVGSVATLGLCAAGLVTRRPLVFALGPVVGYGLAWYGHFVVQGNVPITFARPWLASLGNWRMFAHMVQGTLDDELRAHGIDPETGVIDETEVPSRA